MGTMAGWDGAYWPGHHIQVYVKLRDPLHERMHLFLLVSLREDAKRLDSGYLRCYPLVQKDPIRGAYLVNVYVPGFAGKYTLDVHYFETTRTQRGRRRHNERDCKMRVWHDQSGMTGEGSEVPPAAITPKESFEFRVVAHPLLSASGEPVESLRRQRRQHNVKLFMIRHLEALFEHHGARWSELPIPRLGLSLPAEWWTANDDRNLLLGVYRHGWGRLKALRQDETIGFSSSALHLRLHPTSAFHESSALSGVHASAEPCWSSSVEMGEGASSSTVCVDFPNAAVLNKRVTRLIEALITAPGDKKAVVKKSKTLNLEKATKKEAQQQLGNEERGIEETIPSKDSDDDLVFIAEKKRPLAE